MDAIPLETLHARRARLVQEKAQALANVHAIGGAIQLLDELLAAPPPEASTPGSSTRSSPGQGGQ